MKPVAVLASSCTLAVPVVAVFLITRPVEEAEAELVTLSTLVRHSVSSADLQHLVVGGVQDSGARGATLQGEVHLPEVGYQSRGSHLGGGSGHARHCQACAQHGNSIGATIDRQQVVAYSGRHRIGSDGCQTGARHVRQAPHGGSTAGAIPILLENLRSGRQVRQAQGHAGQCAVLGL